MKHSDNTMHNNNTLLFRAVLNTVGLLVDVEGRIQARYTHNGEFTYQDFSDAELVKIDSRLPKVLKTFLFDSRHDQLEPGILAAFDWVRNTLSLWENPMPVKDIHGEIHYLKSVYELASLNDKTDTAGIVVVSYHLHDVDGTMYASKTDFKSINAPGTELDKHYPGWRERYAVAKTLDIENREQASYIFTKDLVETPSRINNLTFD